MKQGIFRTLSVAIFLLFLSAQVFAQTAAYTLHTIASGESLSSLAKDYHTTVGNIMRLNNMHADSKLQIGEKIKIPATSEPVKRDAATTPSTTPVQSAVSAFAGKTKLTHKVESGESLYRISKMYNISVDKLMAFNHISNTGEIKVGQLLIVGDGTTLPIPAKTKVEATPVTAATPPANDVQQLPAPQPKPAPATTAPVDNNTNTLPPAPAQIPMDSPAATTAPTTTSQVAQPAFASSVTAPKEGFFTAQFRQNVEGRSEQTKSGTAMTFKSASGWADKKFYILMNDAPPGSIVKVMNGTNTVYAKVLWSLGTQKENDGLDFRISTATAAALNITDERFDVTVTYFQ